MLTLACVFPIVSYSTPEQDEGLRRFFHREGITKCDLYLYKFFGGMNGKLVMSHSIRSANGVYSEVTLDRITDNKASGYSFRTHVVINQFENICNFIFESSHVYNVPCKKVFKLPFYKKEEQALSWKKINSGFASHLQAYSGKDADGSTYRRFYKDIWSNHGMTNDGFQQCLVQTYKSFSNKV